MLPVVGVVGVVAKDTATTFNDLPVAYSACFRPVRAA
jgi:hypothetical protein